MLSIATAATIAVAAPGFATGAVLEAAPYARVGVTDNALGASTDQAVRRNDVLVSGGAALALRLSYAKIRHRFGYDFALTRYSTTKSADNVSHTVFWMGDASPNARLALTFGASGSLFQYSALPSTDPNNPNSNLSNTPAAFTPGTLLTVTATQGLTYQPQGKQRYVQNLTVSYIHPLEEASPIPTALRTAGLLGTSRDSGLDTYELTLSGSDYQNLEAPMRASFPTSAMHLITADLLAGWRRKLTATTSMDLRGGALAIYSVSSGSLALGPAGGASMDYISAPWFWNLTISQQPSVNMYLGEAFISDSALLRLSLPLDKLQRLRVSGFGGYSYVRRVASDTSFAAAQRAYDIFTFGASVIYQRETWPVYLSLDGNVMTQRGSLQDGRYYPSTLRRVVTLSVIGTFAWGEGNFGVVRR